MMLILSEGARASGCVAGRLTGCASGAACDRVSGSFRLNSLLSVLCVGSNRRRGAALLCKPVPGAVLRPLVLRRGDGDRGILRGGRSGGGGGWSF